MALKTLAQLKAKFITGYKPTQADFADVFDSTGYLGAEGVQMIYPHLMSKRGSIQLFPITAGKPDGNFAALDLSAEYDYGPVIAHAFYEARKAGPKGAIVVFAGDMVTRRSFVCPPVNGAIMSMTLAASQLLYDGAVGTEFFLSGAKATTITRIPCTTAPSGGNTVVTLAASGHSEKTSTAAGLAGGWINLDYTNFAGEAITVDTWGQWVMQFPALGLTDGTSYFRAAIVSHDIAARTVTLAGNVGFTPTHLHAPGLTSGGTAYDVASCINSMHGLDFLSDMDFQCRNRGTVTQDVQRGVKGLADPRARWNNVRFRQSYATYINHDSDAIVEDLSIVQSFGATTLTSVDSAWQNIQWSATSGVGLTLAGDMSQSTWGGKNKGYYLSRQPNRPRFRLRCRLA